MIKFRFGTCGVLLLTQPAAQGLWAGEPDFIDVKAHLTAARTCVFNSKVMPPPCRYSLQWIARPVIS
jgi:hypothetical protein